MVRHPPCYTFERLEPRRLLAAAPGVEDDGPAVSDVDVEATGWLRPGHGACACCAARRPAILASLNPAPELNPVISPLSPQFARSSADVGPPATGAFSLNVNFQPAGLGNVVNTRADFGRVFAQRGNGLTYGWSRSLEAAGTLQERNSTRDLPGLTFGGARDNSPRPGQQDLDKRFDTFAEVQVGDEWALDVPDGFYAVALVSGDPAFEGPYTAHEHRWSVNGKLAMFARPQPQYPWGEAVVYTEVNDGRIVLRAEEGSRGNSLSWLRVAQIERPTPPRTGVDIDWEFTSQIESPVQRAEGAAKRVGDKFVVMGGYAPGYLSVLDRVDVLNLGTFEWTQGVPLPSSQTHAGVAADADNGHIYWISGQLGTGTDGISFDSTRETWRYVVADDRWERFVDLPQPRFGGAAAVVDGFLYHFGGNDAGRIIARGESWRIDLTADDPQWEQIALMPRPGDHLNAEVIDGRVFITGGEYSHGVSYVQLAETLVYDTATDAWSVGATMPVPSSHNSSLVYAGRIWLFGGQREAQLVIDDVRSYDPDEDVWEVHTPMPQTRKVGYVFELGGRFYYVAGDAFAGGFPTQTIIGTPVA